jgi:hypothetical protein
VELRSFDGTSTGTFSKLKALNHTGTGNILPSLSVRRKRFIVKKQTHWAKISIILINNKSVNYKAFYTKP